MTAGPATASTAERDITARDAMSSPVMTVPETATIFDAWAVMINCKVRHTVVVRDNRCLGVLTDRDLVEAWHAGPGALRATPVRRLLPEHTSCVLPGASLRQVAQVMNMTRVDAVPVVEADGKLAGLVTAGDVVHTVARLGVHLPSAADGEDPS